MAEINQIELDGVTYQMAPYTPPVEVEYIPIYGQMSSDLSKIDAAFSGAAEVRGKVCNLFFQVRLRVKNVNEQWFNYFSFDKICSQIGCSSLSYKNGNTSIVSLTNRVISDSNTTNGIYGYCGFRIGMSGNKFGIGRIYTSDYNNVGQWPMQSPYFQAGDVFNCQLYNLQMG